MGLWEVPSSSPNMDPKKEYLSIKKKTIRLSHNDKNVVC